MWLPRSAGFATALPEASAETADDAAEDAKLGSAVENAVPLTQQRVAAIQKKVPNADYDFDTNRWWCMICKAAGETVPLGVLQGGLRQPPRVLRVHAPRVREEAREQHPAPRRARILHELPQGSTQKVE